MNLTRLGDSLSLYQLHVQSDNTIERINTHFLHYCTTAGVLLRLSCIAGRALHCGLRPHDEVHGDKTSRLETYI